MDERREIHHELERMAHRIRAITASMECGRMTLEEAVRQANRIADRWRVVARPHGVWESPSSRHVLDALKRFHRRRMKRDPEYGRIYRRERRIKARILKDATRLDRVTDGRSLAFYRERLLARWNHAPKLTAVDERRMWEELSASLQRAKDRMAPQTPEWAAMRRESAHRRRELVARVRQVAVEEDLAEARNEARSLVREWKGLPHGRAEQDARLWRQFQAGLDRAFGMAAEPGETPVSPASGS